LEYRVKFSLWVIAAILFATPSVGVAGVLTASNGTKIQHTPVGSMVCKDIESQLDEIDNTGYRQGSPTPTNEADDALYNYERKLSVAYYWRCAAQLDDNRSENAFGLGFTE
jgi:hypothetical protein